MSPPSFFHRGHIRSPTCTLYTATRNYVFEKSTQHRVNDRVGGYNEEVQSTTTGFLKLGLFNEISVGLDSIEIKEPTPVQRAVIPRLLKDENVLMAANTGSGKTLAYALPALQKLLIEEQSGYERRAKRPRVLVLVPTRELARQVLSTIKSLSHFCKVSSCAVMGGEQYGLQKKNLNRLIDIVVASPGRLRQHKEQGHIYLSEVDTVIIDEVDTMLTQGFGPDVRAILRSAMLRRREGNCTANDNKRGRRAQLIMATATLTRPVRALITDLEGGFDINYADSTNITPRKRTESDMTNKVNLKIVEVDGLHKVVANVRHSTELVSGGQDKIRVLRDTLSRSDLKIYRTLIFCNSVTSCQAVAHSLNEAGIESVSYHGDLNSRMREANLHAFREGQAQYLVCTDIAARGLDIPEIEHVIIFDFPLNPVDYLHRAGRCGRAGRSGLVTSLVTKRDKVLSEGIRNAISKGLPLDSLTGNKKDYESGGHLGGVMKGPSGTRRRISACGSPGFERGDARRSSSQKLSKRRNKK